MTKPLRIALTKGRLEKDTVGLLEKLGYTIDFADSGWKYGSCTFQGCRCHHLCGTWRL